MAVPKAEVVLTAAAVHTAAAVPTAAAVSTAAVVSTFFLAFEFSCNGSKLHTIQFCCFLFLLFFSSYEDFFCGECYRLIEFLKMKPVKKKESGPEW